MLRQHYAGYELRDCWPSHIHAVWELSTLAAAWHHAYGGQRPDLGRALEFYDRWLPGTMRRIAAITRACVPQCVMRRRLVTDRPPAACGSIVDEPLPRSRQAWHAGCYAPVFIRSVNSCHADAQTTRRGPSGSLLSRMSTALGVLATSAQSPPPDPL